jgi:hypothetical protein
LVISQICSVHGLAEDPQVRAVYADITPETRPRSATERSTVRYGFCDADHRNGRVYFGPRYFSPSRDARRNSRHSGRSSRVKTRSAHVQEGWGNLGRTRRPVVPRYSGQVTVVGPASGRAHGTGLRSWGPVVILRAARDEGVQVGSIVMALSPPRYLTGRFGAGAWGSVRGGPARGTSSAPRRPLPHRHQFQLRMSQSFPLIVVAIEEKRPDRSPVPVAHGALPSIRGISGRYRVASPVPVARGELLSGRGVVKPGAVGPARTFAQVRSLQGTISPGVVAHWRA